MQLQTEIRKVEGLENFSGVTCSVSQKNLGILIYALIQKNYKDKILAGIREIICNAVDANRFAEKSHVPVVITLPTFTDPYFRVKDSGKGMSQYFMSHEYASVGESTKRNSDLDIGGFGLGRFAPLAYISGFDLKSICDGYISHYTVQIDKTGGVVVIPVHSEPTDLESGVEVSIAVANNDIGVFRRKVLEFCQFLPTKPTFLNLQGDSELFLDKLVEYPTWFATRNAPISSNTQASAIVGGVRYPIDYSALNITDASLQKALTSKSLFFVFNIGEVDIPPSRESLEYTPKTIAAITRAVDIMKKDVLLKLEKIDEFPDILSAINFAYEIWSSYPFTGINISDVIYKGVRLYTNIERRTDFSDGPFEVSLYETRLNKYTHSPEKICKQKGEDKFSIRESSLSIVIWDLESSHGITSRLKDLENRGFRKFVIINSFNALCKKFLDKYGMQYYPCTKIFKASELKKITPQRSASSLSGESRSRKDIKYFLLNTKRYSWRLCDMWEDIIPDDIVEEETKFFLPIKGMKWVDSRLDFRLFVEILDDVLRTSNIFIDIYGVRCNDVEKLDSTWKPAIPEIIKLMKEKLASKEFEEAIANLNFVTDDFKSVIESISPFDKVFDEEHLISKTVRLVNACRYSNKPSIIHKCLNFMKNTLNIGVEDIIIPSVPPAKNLCEKVSAKYPMLSICGNNIWRDSDKQIVKNYVKMVDSITVA